MLFRICVTSLFLTTALFSFEEPAAEPTPISVSPLDQSRVGQLDAQEDAARTLLRAIAAERQQIRLSTCLREGLKAIECGPLNRDQNGNAFVLKLVIKVEKPSDGKPPEPAAAKLTQSKPDQSDKTKPATTMPSDSGITGEQIPAKSTVDKPKPGKQ